MPLKKEIIDELKRLKFPIEQKINNADDLIKLFLAEHRGFDYIWKVPKDYQYGYSGVNVSVMFVRGPVEGYNYDESVCKLFVHADSGNEMIFLDVSEANFDNPKLLQLGNNSYGESPKFIKKGVKHNNVVVTLLDFLKNLTFKKSN